MDQHDKIATALAKQNMRPACSWEQGWYVDVLIEGEPRKVWATDQVSGHYLARFKEIA